MSKNKYMITRVQNRKPYNFKNIIQKDDGVLYFNYEEKIITQLVKSRDEDEFKAVCLRIQDFIEKENIDVCFVINQDELVDCLTEHQKLKLNIAELEHRLSNCIEPKFKVGQEIWEITPLMSWKIKRIEWHKFNGGNRDVVMEIYRLGHDGNDDYNCCIMPVDSDRFFATEAEAKAKLEELKK